MRRWVLSLVVSSGVALGTFAACSFPEPLFTDDDGLDGSIPDGTAKADTSADAPRSEGSADEDAGEVLIDGSSPDALISGDAGQRVDASGCDPTDCDCDRDGFNETLKAGCNDGGRRDCDDTDPRANPGAGFRTDPPEGPMFSDWNCDGKATPLYDVNVSCEGLTLGLNCPTIFGFSDNPRCGQSGTWIRCKAGLLSCVVGTTTPLVQPCQ